MATDSEIIAVRTKYYDCLDAAETPGSTTAASAHYSARAQGLRQALEVIAPDWRPSESERQLRRIVRAAAVVVKAIAR
jgi:L-fucose isomerase-like protein